MIKFDFSKLFFIKKLNRKLKTMKLTGKAKEEFEKWWYEEYLFGLNHIVKLSIDDFYDSLYSMQFGVYQDYADSVGIKIELYRVSLRTWNFKINGVLNIIKRYPTRPEARTAAIEKLNELLNKKL